MNIIDGRPHSYLGDGVYAIFDGYGIWLRANDHRESRCSDKIYLEPSVLRSLNIFNEEVEKWHKVQKN